MLVKSSLVTTLLLLTAGWTTSVSAADIIPLKGVSLLMVNGIEADSKMKPSALKTGQNQIVVEMDKLIGKGSSNGQFTSKPYIITFKAGSEDVKINHPKVHSLMNAEAAFKNDPQWRLTSQGNSVAYQSDELKGRGGFMPYSDMDELVQEYNQQNDIYIGPAAVAAASEVASVSVNKAASEKPAKQKKSQAATHPQALEQMKAWYLKASKQERKEFRKWMIDQE